MRLFTGLAIPVEATSALVTLVNGLRPRMGEKSNLKWTAPEKLHITTVFVGEWPESKLPELAAALRAVQVRGPIEVQIQGLGWMPNPRYPRSLYAGVESNDPFQQLAAETSRVAAGIGVPIEDRIYRPHITLARVRGRFRGEIPLDTGPIASFGALSFFLYLSAGGKYTKLEEFSLLKP